MDRPILILGGYGNTGSRVAALLLQHSDATVVVAGRDRDRARATAGHLKERHGPGRALAVRLDAGDTAGLRAAFDDVGFVVNASNTVPYTEQVVSAALVAGADYIDTQLSLPPKLEVLGRLAPQIEREGRCFVTDAGFHPGVPAAMVRLAVERLGTVERADIGSCIQLDWNAYRFSEAALPEMLDEFEHFRPRYFEDGRWKERWRTYRYFDFGEPFGRRYTMPMDLDEMHALPEYVPSLRQTGFFVGGFDPVTDFVVMPPVALGLKVLPRSARSLLGNLLLWSLRRFSRPPFGTVLVLEAAGATAGAESSFRLRIAHADGYHLTAAPVVAALLQYLDGHRPPGLWHQAHFVEPERFFDDLRKMDVEVECGETKRSARSGAKRSS